MSAIDVLVVTYRPDDTLRMCVDSVIGNTEARVVIAVNNVPEVARPVIDELRTTYRGLPVQFVDLGQNWGYAEGINRGLAHCQARHVLLLNDDASLEANALKIMSDALDTAASRVVGIVPKTVLAYAPRVIDNVGTGFRRNGWNYNRGVGEIDIGQFDRVEPVAGACFAAVLLRRASFHASEVGLLDRRFFMYCEDSDWCLRARLKGYGFLTAPEAVVRHEHSHSTKSLSSDFKRALIGRNSTLLVVKCFPTPLALRLAVPRIGRDVAGALVGPQRHLARKRVREIATRLPGTLVERKRLRGLWGSVPADTDLFTLADDVEDHAEVNQEGKLVPRQDRSTLIAMYRRRARRGDSEITSALQFAMEDELVARVAPLVADDPPEVMDLLMAVSGQCASQ